MRRHVRRWVGRTQTQRGYVPELDDTPEWLYVFFKDYFDPCPRGKPKFDGLKVKWKRLNFVNPPYDGKIKSWVQKALEESTRGCNSVMLLPVDPAAAWWQLLMYFEDRVAIGWLPVYPTNRGNILVFINGKV